MKLDIGKDEFAEVLLPCQEFQGWTVCFVVLTKI